MVKTLIVTAILIVLAGLAATPAYAQTPEPPKPLVFNAEVENRDNKVCVVTHNFFDWKDSEITEGWSLPTTNNKIHPSYTSLPAWFKNARRGEVLKNHHDSQREHLYTIGQEPGLPAIVGLLVSFIDLHNEHQHKFNYTHKKSVLGEWEYTPVSTPFNWSTQFKTVDLYADLQKCLATIDHANRLENHRAETYAKLVAKETELAIAKERLVTISEWERIETDLTIKLIALNTEILDTIIQIEQVRLAGMERRAELILEAAERDATRWQEWMLQSGNRFDDLESKRAETARILAETRKQQAEYRKEMQEAIRQERETRQQYESNLAEVEAEHAEIAAQLEELAN